MLKLFGRIPFIVLGIWLVLPSRNWVGNPLLESPKGECRDQHGAVIRLYVGDGGALDWWQSVTVHPPGIFAREQQIIFTDRVPEIDSLRCLGDAVILENATAPIRLEYSRAVTELTVRPLLYFDGELLPPFIQPVRIVTLSVGWLLLAWPALKYARYRRSRHYYQAEAPSAE